MTAYPKRLHTVRKLCLCVGIMIIAAPILSGLASEPLQAQTSAEQALLLRATGPLPAFEVATVKPSKPGITGSNFNLELGTDRFSIVNMPIKGIIHFAFRAVNDDQVTGLPPWGSDEPFTITAKLDETQASALRKMPPDQSTDRLRLMVQSLLVDRFHMAVTVQDRKLPLLALIVAKGGPKLTEVPQSKLPTDSDFAALFAPGAKPQPEVRYPSLHGGNGHLEAGAVSLRVFTDWISAQQEGEGRIVVDQTGLEGKYDFHLDWAPDNTSAGAAEPSPGPLKAPFNTALKEQLGLKLKAMTGDVPVVVVEHIEKPTDN